MIETAPLLEALGEAVGRGAAPGPRLRSALAGSTDPAVLRRAGTVLADLPAPTPGLRPLRVAVLGTATLGSYPALLRAGLVGAGFAPEITTGDYGAFSPTLGAARFATADGGPDVVSCVLDDGWFRPSGGADPADVDAFEAHVADRTAALTELVDAACARSSASIVLHTVPLPATVTDAVLGWRERARMVRVWHSLNADIAALAERSPQVAVADLSGSLAGVAWRDDRLHRFGDLPYTDAALVVLAGQVRRFAQARAGLSRKVLALDLDDTLWGGVLGEVGATGVALGGLYPGNCYSALQEAARSLRAQGVVLVLASKNDAEPVHRALSEHPEVRLRPDDFSATAVNWAPKAQNLRAAASSLGLDVSSFVFLDDSPFERGHVEAELPQVAVLAADGDPANLVATLLAHGWFDVPELTGTDRERPQLYRTRALRADFATGFGSDEEYLTALGLELTPEPATAYTVGRIAQLAARTNQFNVAGRRYDEAATSAMADDPDHLVLALRTRDRFGDDGIVGAVWVECESDTWRVTDLVLSCRVLGRGVEIAAAGWLAARAWAAGATAVEARYVPTDRNGVAADFWNRAGFRPTGEPGRFRLEAGDPVPATDWITVRDDAHAA